MAYGKTIELFLVNGTADSIITAELSNWNGKAVKIPRIEVPSCKREDICDAGVYFLFCKDDDGTDAVYIGEAENVKERLIQHLRDSQAEKEKYYWTTAVLFTGRDLNKALIRYLENRLVEIARSSNRYKVLTKNTYRNTVMKESQISAMDEFIENIKVLINALGYKVLEPFVSQNTTGAIDKASVVYSITTGSASARGIVRAEGFVVYKGATINEKISVKNVNPGIVKLREKYYSEKRVLDNTIMEDLLFSSSSAAACFVLGYNVSGPKTWKAENGRTLKEIEFSETN